MRVLSLDVRFVCNIGKPKHTTEMITVCYEGTNHDFSNNIFTLYCTFLCIQEKYSFFGKALLDIRHI